MTDPAIALRSLGRHSGRWLRLESHTLRSPCGGYRATFLRPPGSERVVLWADELEGPVLLRAETARQIWAELVRHGFLEAREG